MLRANPPEPLKRRNNPSAKLTGDINAVDFALGHRHLHAAIQFDAVAGDWAFHCHKSHHAMNAMGHQVNTYIGVDFGNVGKQISRVVPGQVMTMGETGRRAQRAGRRLPQSDVRLFTRPRFFLCSLTQRL